MDKSNAKTAGLLLPGFPFVFFVGVTMTPEACNPNSGSLAKVSATFSTRNSCSKYSVDAKLKPIFFPWLVSVAPSAADHKSEPPGSGREIEPQCIHPSPARPEPQLHAVLRRSPFARSDTSSTQSGQCNRCGPGDSPQNSESPPSRAAFPISGARHQRWPGLQSAFYSTRA